MNVSKRQLAKMIDHTLIKPDATESEVARLCAEAKKFGFGCVCVNPVYLSLTTRLLEGADVKVCSTVGFPFGATFPGVKAFEAEQAIERGARELDMVINVGALKSGNRELVKRDIEAVVKVANAHGDITVKVIIETGRLTDEEKVAACKIAETAGADFVKTSTGLVGGATVEDVRLMRKSVGTAMGVKAAGGIRTLKDTLTMIDAGASRIGTSTGVAIFEELNHGNL